jgi:hypothetical protein
VEHSGPGRPSFFFTQTKTVGLGGSGGFLDFLRKIVSKSRSFASKGYQDDQAKVQSVLSCQYQEAVISQLEAASP